MSQIPALAAALSSIIERALQPDGNLQLELQSYQKDLDSCLIPDSYVLHHSNLISRSIHLADYLGAHEADLRKDLVNCIPPENSFANWSLPETW